MKPFLFLFAVPIVALPSIARASDASDIYDKLRQVWIATPEVGEVTICLPNSPCETFDTTQLEFERKGGKPELLYERPKDADSSQAISGAAGALLGSIREVVGVGGSFKVDLETRKDGTFKLHVEGSFGTGAAAGTAAGGQTTPDPAPALPSRPGGGGGSSGHAVLN